MNDLNGAARDNDGGTAVGTGDAENLMSAPSPQAGNAVLYNNYVHDYVISADGLTAYAAGEDGVLRAYNVESGELIRSWAIATHPGGLAISPDGSFLILCEQQPLSQTGSQWDAQTTVTAYKIDLATGAVQNFPFVATGYDDAFQDVEILADGKAYFSQGFRGSGFTSIRVLDPTTGAYTALPGTYYSPALTRDPDGTRLLIGIANLSSADEYLYDPRTGSITTGGTVGPEYGIQAISTAANLIVHRGGNQVFLFDASLHFKQDLSATLPFLHDATGLAFDGSGHNLFAIDSANGTIVQIATATWTIVQSIPLPAGAFTFNLTYGNELIVGPDDRYFLLYAGGTLMRVDNPLVPDAIVGTQGDDVLTGTAGNDVLIGYQGSDSMTGGGGNDEYHVDRQGDHVVELAGGGIDTIVTSVSYALEPGSDIEIVRTSNPLGVDPIDLTGNGLANALYGNEGANHLSGGGGTDLLTGNGGNDIIDGGTGADTMAGGTGNDLYFVDDAADSVIELPDQGTDSVQAGIDYVIPANVEALILTGNAVQGVGNELDNHIVGNDQGNLLSGMGGADSIEGGAGNDTLLGGEGNDILDGGADVDTASYAAAAVGVTVDLTVSGPQDTGQGHDTLISIENVTGSAHDDVLTGDGGDNGLAGGAGNDTLAGGGGNDVLDGGADVDTASYASAASGVTVDLTASGPQDTGQGHDTLISIENVTGSAHDDVLTGDGGNNGLAGGDGQDWLQGGGGADTESGGTGHDSVWGGAGDDLLSGGLGDDTIDGGAGNDTVTYADAGSRVEVDLSWLEDQNTRGAGVDTLVSIENVIGSAYDDALTGNAGANVLTGGGGADVLTGGDGNDVFAYLALSDLTVAAPDLIMDFSPGDRIDLSALDADRGTPGDQAFHLGATAGHVGDIVLVFDAASERTAMNLYVDGDAIADATIWLAGNQLALTGGDIVA